MGAYAHQEMYTRMFKAALFIILKNWKQQKMPISCIMDFFHCVLLMIKHMAKIRTNYSYTQ